MCWKSFQSQSELDLVYPLRHPEHWLVGLKQWYPWLQAADRSSLGLKKDQSWESCLRESLLIISGVSLPWLKNGRNRDSPINSSIIANGDIVNDILKIVSVDFVKELVENCQWNLWKTKTEINKRQNKSWANERFKAEKCLRNIA